MLCFIFQVGGAAGKMVSKDEQACDTGCSPCGRCAFSRLTMWLPARTRKVGRPDTDCMLAFWRLAVLPRLLLWLPARARRCCDRLRRLFAFLYYMPVMAACIFPGR